jgi:hypothetical protein
MGIFTVYIFSQILFLTLVLVFSFLGVQVSVLQVSVGTACTNVFSIVKDVFIKCCKGEVMNGFDMWTATTQCMLVEAAEKRRQTAPQRLVHDYCCFFIHRARSIHRMGERASNRSDFNCNFHIPTKPNSPRSLQKL